MGLRGVSLSNIVLPFLTLTVLRDAQSAVVNGSHETISFHARLTVNSAGDITSHQSTHWQWVDWCDVSGTVDCIGLAWKEIVSWYLKSYCWYC